MRKVKLYIASSIDAYIAGPNGEIDWLFTEGEFGYNAFMETIDTTLMGHDTYKLVAGFNDFPYKNQTNYVFTRNPTTPEAPYVQFVSEDVASFVEQLKQQDGKDIFLIGGGQINAILLEAGLIDELQVFVHPIILGKGIPMFQPTSKPDVWQFVETKAFECGLVELHYVKKG
ncbi:dihydrofolate reductase family protein [Larkinella rosea]|uniref:Dihydrofolate reductase n=1 Tax=Larkinella rosea TaxID=2025312 RepID=A0A3P1C217_9BACT|nr:dihydrofolate reductase family protein [Larkinella rosea]RRB07425.1 dihydrofolate reductase [Larkinella rosea]